MKTISYNVHYAIALRADKQFWFDNYGYMSAAERFRQSVRLANDASFMWGEDRPDDMIVEALQRRKQGLPMGREEWKRISHNYREHYYQSYIDYLANEGPYGRNI